MERVRLLPWATCPMAWTASWSRHSPGCPVTGPTLSPRLSSHSPLWASVTVAFPPLAGCEGWGVQNGLTPAEDTESQGWPEQRGWSRLGTGRGR